MNSFAGAMFPPAAALTTEVEMSVSCEDLGDRDLVSKSDPCCVLLRKLPGPGGAWAEVGRTERIKDCLDPRWTTKFVVTYSFEEKQLLKFCVYDIDSSSGDLSDHDALGVLECSLGEIMAAQSKGFSRQLTKGQGIMKIHSEEISNNNDLVTIQFQAMDLDKKDLFGKSDPYFEISRVNESNDFSIVYRSEVIMNNLNPTWKSFEIESRTLCNGDLDRVLKIEVLDKDSDGSSDLIGSFRTTLRRLSCGPSTDNVYDCINEKKKAKKGSKYKNSGVIKLIKINTEKIPSFLEILRGGLQLNFTLAVDFTGSNGNPADPRSLHYRDPSGRPNQYQAAITAVGDIVQDYDSDKMFPALGFGARVPPHGAVSHEFFLSLDPASPFCAGLEGVMAAYNNALHNVQLYGPTNFSPVIRHVAKFAHTYQNDPTNYFVLLIITDGIITDFDETKRAIIESSSLPLSIIIVGVGNEDFEAMEELDSDEALLRHGSLVAKRDIVQFVEMRKFIQKNGTWSKEQLAAEVLAEIPGQMLSFMKSKGFTPPAASAASSSFTTSPPQMAHASAPMIINP